ncbi:MAG TPA: HAD family hydrolase [Vicinamibacterales bacterium]|nr:HAD family hydrolase [Vicinamibacterales bacterium]
MIELVALDADDTLWHNEPLYTSTREQFRALLTRYDRDVALDDRLYEIELRNLQHFGYGVKGFVLSMIETAVELTGGRLDNADVLRIIEWGRSMLGSPVELLDGAREAVEELAHDYPIILLTKGDLLHQETKLARSGLGPFFKGIEIVSEKHADVYRSVMRRYDVPANRFVMVGNSLRSDILPAIDAGAHAVFVPYEICWVHERVSPEAQAAARYHEIAHIRELPSLLGRLSKDLEPCGSVNEPP